MAGSSHLATPLSATLARAALDLAENMVVITDRSGRIVYVNEAFCRVTGYANDEALGNTPALLRSGVQDDPFYATLWQRILDGKVWEGELVNRRKDGTLYTDRMTITPMRNSSRAITHFVAVKRDVSSHLAALTAGSPSGAAHLDPTGRLVYANQRLEQLLGIAFDGLLGSGWQRAFAPDDARRLEDAIRAAPREGEVVTAIPVRDGVTVRVHVAPLEVGGEAPAGVVATFEDVTREATAEQSLRAREEYARAILDSLATPTAVVDARGVIRAVNRAWQERGMDGGADAVDTGVGVDYAAVCRRSAERGCLEAGQALEALQRVLAGRQEPAVVEYAFAPREWWELRVTPLQVSEGGAVLSHTDISSHRALQELLAARARTDPLTGLLNRTGLAEHAGPALARARRSGVPVTVVFLDLDRFKPINDRHGHDAGDAVLCACARQLQAVVRESDVVARVGGDEFVVLAEQLTDADAVALAGRLVAAVERPTAWREQQLQVAASAGMARSRPDTELEALLRAADEQMYRAKRKRRQIPQ